jgi:hypothetical protein
MEDTVESSRLLTSSASAFAPGHVATTALLRGIVLTTRGGGVLSKLLLVLRCCAPGVEHALAGLGPAMEVRSMSC